MIKKLLLTLILTVSMLAVVRTFAKTYRADVQYKTARNLFESGRSIEALDEINKSIENNPNEPSYYRERAKIYLALGTNQGNDAKKELKTHAAADLNKAAQLNPNNLATIRNGTPVYYFLAVEELSEAESLENIDPQYSKLVTEYLQKYKKTYANDLGMQVLIAKYEKKLGLNENFNSTIENIKNLRPEILEWHPDLITLR